jgi:uncharacterized repeat protein (TIGR01451 family)
VLVAIVGAVAALAGPGWGSDPEVPFTADGALATVTAGRTAEVTFAVSNHKSRTLNYVTFHHVLPAGASLVSATSSQGSCSQSGSTVSCLLGKIRSGAGAMVTVAFSAPASDFQSCGTITWKQTGSTTTFTDTTCAQTAVRPADDPNFQGGCIGAETVISTGSAATGTDRQTTSLRTPDGACVSVAEVPATSPTDACGAGETCKTDVSEIEHPPCAVGNPCTITVTFDSSFGTVKKLYYNGVLVQPCTTPGVASPDPCLVSRTLLPRSLARALPGPRDTQFVILSAIDAKLRGG